MKTLIISDLHHGHSISEFFIDYEMKLFDWFEDIILTYDIENIVNMGDTHDKQMSVSPKIANLFRDRHKRLSEMVANYFIIAGNHDCYYKTSNSVTSLPFFFKEDNQILIERKPLKFINYCFIPWISPENSEEIKKFVRENNNSNNYLFSHLESSGFKNGAITTKTDQLYISEYGNYKKVFSGHYHAKQSKDNLLYVGNPFQKTFGEMESKFVHVLDDDKLISLQNKNDIFTRVNILDGLSDTEIEDIVKVLKDKIVQVYIASSDFDYINKVEMIIDKYRPYEAQIKTKNVLEEVATIEIDNSSEEELNKSFLSNLEYPSEDFKTKFSEKFDFYWKKSENK